jgi:hypothetical protein
VKGCQAVVIAHMASRQAGSYQTPTVPFDANVKGTANLFFAGGLRQSPGLEQQGQVILPSAYELDDAPGFERFFLVSSSRPFELQDVEKAVRALASRPVAAETERLALPPGVNQFSIVLKKKG